MLDYVEKWGDNVDSAVELALKDLKLTRDEVKVTILEQPSRGFLGIFKNKLAKVRVERKPEEPIVKEADGEILQDSVSVPASNSSDNHEHDTFDSVIKGEADQVSLSANIDDRMKGVSVSGSSVTNKVNKGPVRYPKAAPLNTKFTITDEDVDAIPAMDEPAVGFVKEVAEKMGINVGIKAHLMDYTLYIELEGNDVGTMIGKRGNTLDSIQYLASIVQNKNSENRFRVIINAEKYREKREKTLQELAKRLGNKCIRTGKYVRLEPMNPYERKVIHAALQDNPKVTTKSEGVEPNRRVIIKLKNN